MGFAAEPAFFAFMREREAIRLRKEADRIASEQGEIPQGPPWTDDPILREYKFTNVRRYHDWTTDQLRSTFYSEHFYDDPRTILMNCALFRYFGTFEFAEAVGWYDHDAFDLLDIEECATTRLENGERVFTGAYVITNQGISAPKQEVVVHHFLSGLLDQVDEVVEVAKESRSWREVVTFLSHIKGFGGTGFMAKEILLDTMMTNFWGDQPHYSPEGIPFTYPDDYGHWTPIGPGGLRGASRVSGSTVPAPLQPGAAMHVIKGLTESQDEHWPKEYGKLYPTDIQFQLCEFDKYERVRLGQGRPRSKYRPRKV